jgi:protocatechuate 3,4-dioxygenase beta subunit
VIVHPAAAYAGLRTPSSFVRAGEPLIVDAAVVDPEGNAIAGRPLLIRALRQQLRFEPGNVSARELEEGRCELRSTERPLRCRLERLPAGDYIIAATVEDARGRRSLTELPLRVAGETVPAASRSVRDTLAVMLDRESYAPDDTMTVRIETSLAQAEALLTLRRAGIIESHTTKVDNGVATLLIPVHDAFVPNVQLHVAAIARNGITATGTAEAAVVPTTRTLSVTVEPRSVELTPGATTTVDVAVIDPAGRPVADADVVLSGADEALYALSRREWPGSVGQINDESRAGVLDGTLREYLTPHTDVSLAPRTIEGIVLDGASGRSMPGAWVEIAGSARGAWTGPDGRFRITDVPAGVHDVAARANGYVTTPAATVSVTNGRGSRAHFTMFTRSSFLQRHIRGEYFMTSIRRPSRTIDTRTRSPGRRGSRIVPMSAFDAILRPSIETITSPPAGTI